MKMALHFNRRGLRDDEITVELAGPIPCERLGDVRHRGHASPLDLVFQTQVFLERRSATGRVHLTGQAPRQLPAFNVLKTRNHHKPNVLDGAGNSQPETKEENEERETCS